MGRYRVLTKALSIGRHTDGERRRVNLARALRAAASLRASHVVLSGDLTEMGHEVEFEVLAELLHEAGFPEDAITLVPGNHDHYTRGAWARAMAGPLRAFARASAAGERAGSVVEREDAVFFPLDSTIFQSVLLSRGTFDEAMARVLEGRFSDVAFRDKALVLVMHHPPYSYWKAPLRRFFDRLDGHETVQGMLVRHERVQVLHGHLHDAEVLASGLPTLTKGRIFRAPAVVDDEAEPRVQLYDVIEGGLKLVA